MKLTHLRDVMAVAECGSLRAAARHLGIAQPAITRSIREIESELDACLFERHAKGARLTPMGKAFVRRATAIESELRRARDEIDQLKGMSTGEVSLALSSAASIALMPNVLAQYLSRFPNALLKVTESLFQQVENELRDGKIDFYVGPMNPEISQTQLEVEVLFDNQRIVVARKGHPLSTSDSLQDLIGAKWVRPTLTPRSSEADFDAWFERAGLPQPQIAVHANTALTTLQVVASSDLLTIIPQQWLDLSIMSDRLEALALAKPMRAAQICIVRRRELPLTPIAEYLYHQFLKFGALYAKERSRQAR